MKQKYVGIGNQDTSGAEWLDNVRRDTYSNLISHSGSLEYIALAKGQSKEVARIQMLQKMRPTENSAQR